MLPFLESKQKGKEGKRFQEKKEKDREKMLKVGLNGEKRTKRENKGKSRKVRRKSGQT